MKCPTCSVPIEEHPASACLDAWIAQAVFGLKPEYDGKYFMVPADSRSKWVVKPYSGSIGAAWELVEKLRQNGLTVLVIAGADMNRQGCRIGRVGAAPFPVEDIPLYGKIYLDKSIGVNADTAPLAIVRAAIKAVLDGKS